MAAVARLIQESGLSLGTMDEKLVTVIKWFAPYRAQLSLEAPC